MITNFMIVMESSIPLGEVPVAALRNATRGIISNLLNPCKILPSPSKYPRDFRGLAYLANLPLPPCNCQDPTASVLKSWEKTNNPSVAEFISALELIDRWDVIDDIQDLVGKDILEFSKDATALEKPNVPQNLDSDNHILTIDDVLRIEKGLEPQFYDAFLLYSDDDVEFAREMIDRLEQQYHLKLCIKDRDLVGGVTFEHEAIMRLISERCKRLIIIISPSFMESPANKFFVTFAQALGIEQRRRKIIPCTYKNVRLPPELAYYFILHHNRTSPLWNFWDQLSASVRAPLPGGEPARSKVQSSVRITELPAGPAPLPADKWDCPEKKSPQRPPKLLAIRENGAACMPYSSTGSHDAANSPSAAACPSVAISHITPESSKAAADSSGPKSDKTKSKSFSFSNLLPNPPSTKLKKIKWWKNKKKMMVESSL